MVNGKIEPASESPKIERQDRHQKRVINMVWANEAGVSVYIYEGEHDRRVVEIHGVVNDYETVLATATVEKHNRDTFAGAVGLDAQKWKRRVLAFQEGYRDKSLEVTTLMIQNMDLRAHGVDKVTARQNASLRTKLLATCIERNEAREALRGLLRGKKCWCQTWVGSEHEPECEAARTALALVDGPQEGSA